jgi:hypothetical protein
VSAHFCVVTVKVPPMSNTDTDIAASPITSPPALPSAEYLTRRQAADYIRDVLGRPMSFSTAQKLAALGEFAEPALWWGRRPLYHREALRAWTEARSRPSAATAGSAASAAPEARGEAPASQAAGSSPAAKKRIGKAARRHVAEAP